MNFCFPFIERNLLEQHRRAWDVGNRDLMFAGGLGRYWPTSGVRSPEFQARFPDGDQLVRMGLRAASRRIRYWHPWHMEQTHWEHRLSKKIDWFTPPNGDHEWIESLVRFDHMIDLAAAYRLTGEKRFVNSFDRYLRSFFESRAKPGRHWQYKLNPAIRIINLIRAYDLLAREIALDHEIHLLVFENILIDGQHIARNLNEATGNGAFFLTTALLIAAVYLENLFRLDAWRHAAETNLSRILASELQDDGFEAEQVPMYHGQVLLTLLDYCVALKANERLIDPPLRVALRRMLQAIGTISDPQGNIPSIGDSDRFDVSYIYHFYNTVLNKDASIEQDWVKSVSEFGGSSAKFQVARMVTTGWIVVRWNDEENRKCYLLFDCSGKPRPGYGSHSHADDLQFILHDSRGPILTDPGRFTYCTEFKAFFPWTRWRINPHGKFRALYKRIFPTFMRLTEKDWKGYFKSTLSHNTLSCDEGNQAGYENRRDAGGVTKLERFSMRGPLILMQGVLNCLGGAVSNAAPDGYLHRRLIVGFYPDLWIVIDRVRSARQHRWTSSFHIDSSCNISQHLNSYKIEVNNGVHQFYGVSGSCDQECVVSVEDDWVSPAYNLRLSGKTLRIRSPMTDDAELVGVMHMNITSKASMERVESISISNDADSKSQNGYCIYLRRNEVVTRILINPDALVCDVGDLCTDATVAFASYSKGRLWEAGFLNGRYLKCGHVALVAENESNMLHFAGAQY